MELSSTPDGTAPGKSWDVEMTILQHGKTPLEGVRPLVMVTNRDTGSDRVFHAAPTGTPGVYRASVVFPKAGTYEYQVDNGFSHWHSYPAVRIAAAPATPSAPDDGFPWAPILAALAAGGLAAAGTAALQRRRMATAP